MNKEFIPHEQALALKELGFNEPCFAVTHRDGTLFSLVPAFTKDLQVEGFASIKNSECLWEDDQDSLNGIQEVATPTFSQTFIWFREKRNLLSVIEITIESSWYFSIYNLNAKRNAEIVDDNVFYKEEFITYEEAELACLRKLIEIVKNETRHN